MASFLKLVVVVPLALLAVAFAVANRQGVTVSFDPFATDLPAFALTGPLFLVLLITVVSGVVLGGVAAWLGQGHNRRALRQARRDAEEQRGEVARLKAEVARLSREQAAAGTALAVAPGQFAA